TDLRFYEGLHGAVVTEAVNIARYADLKIGVVPVINLEWIQKIHRDRSTRGYSTEDVPQPILRRIPDSLRYILPPSAVDDRRQREVAREFHARPRRAAGSGHAADPDAADPAAHGAQAPGR